MLFLIAGILAMATGLAHSVLGEILIFRHLRKGGLVPSMGAPPLRERNIREAELEARLEKEVSPHAA